MLLLCMINGRELSLEYKPEMPVWLFLRDHLAPSACFKLVNRGRTLRQRVRTVRGVLLDFFVRRRLLGELVADGERLVVCMGLGPSYGIMEGNACLEGGDFTECAICCEPSFDVALDCLHRFHVRCVCDVRDGLCPNCRVQLTRSDREHIQTHLNFARFNRR
jgi:hypothetical protein